MHRSEQVSGLPTPGCILAGLSGDDAFRDGGTVYDKEVRRAPEHTCLFCVRGSFVRCAVLFNTPTELKMLPYNVSQG